ncbi:hypothetical protein AGRA3207_005120 [Actinomadura graeca]|uniref:Uncharacterized protein n=1 Tax=Actinomadura graeca TaxID=2750812 RepID=A0ABX8QZ52_9ACTN|nr:hypothetical protein [Actinomadura graeca]QXJ23898.1 hypothetical protein AGRA3207_005120 [Actinomadura graeca]
MATISELTGGRPPRRHGGNAPEVISGRVADQQTAGGTRHAAGGREERHHSV